MALNKEMRFENVFIFKKSLFQNNKLSSIKDGGNLCDLSLLKLLDLSSNKLAKLPPEIKYLKNLQVHSPFDYLYYVCYCCFLHLS